MKVVVRDSTMVRPAKEAPKTKLWNSCLDLMVPDFHAPQVYFYRANGAHKFFDSNVMKESLSRVLVVFYPMGGRFKRDKDGRIEIDCQGQGALFLEAECDGVVDDYGDLAHEFMKLVPEVDYSSGIESYPLLVTQVTYFKCGGVSLGFALHNYVSDGLSATHFLTAWSAMANGLSIAHPAFIDRTILRSQGLQKPIFNHLEYHPDQTANSIPQAEPYGTTLVYSIFKITRNQLNILKQKAKEDGSTISYSSFEILSGHVWKCVCIARELLDKQTTMLHIPTDGRARLEPPLPPNYLGNVILTTAVTSTAWDIKSKPFWYAASKIHDALAIMKDNYIKSAIAYLEQHLDQNFAVSYKSTNFRIISWAKFPMYSVDFGWGRPIFAGPAFISLGYCFVLPNPINDGSLSFVIGLDAEQTKRFSNLLYGLGNVTWSRV